MKKLILFISLLATTVTTAHSQGYYSFSHFSSTYAELTNPIQLFPTGFFDTLVLGFNITLDGRTNDSLRLRLKGSISADSITTFSERVFEPFGGEHGQGQYGYLIEGTFGNRIVKIQYKNVKFDHDMSGNDRINFQVWLHESDNTIEVHYGPSTIQNASWDYYYNESGPYIGFIGFHLTGLASSPVVDTSSTPNLRLTGTPPNGMVYRFEPAPNHVITTNKNDECIIPYPNPTVNTLFLGKDISGPVQIIDITGRIQITLPRYNPSTGIPTSTLSTGLYFISVKDKHYPFYKL